MQIAIIDYGLGNLHSVQKALEHVAPKARIKLAYDKKTIQSADRILLPGQGAIAACMKAIQKQELIEALLKAAKEKPFLGICIGPQLMMEKSAENGGVKGLGLFKGEVIRFDSQSTDGDMPIKIPHMGWNTIKQTTAHPLWQNIKNHSHFYYVHSYHLPQNHPYTIGETIYGTAFPAAIAHENIAGLQAHPEKSAENGLQFLKNFIHWQP